MVKIVNPFHSTAASGKFGTITFERRNKKTIIRQNPDRPTDPKTAKQETARGFFTDSVALWHMLTASTGIFADDGETLLEAITGIAPERLTPYAYFLHAIASYNYRLITNADEAFALLNGAQQLRLESAEESIKAMVIAWQPAQMTKPKLAGAITYALSRCAATRYGITNRPEAHKPETFTNPDLFGDAYLTFNDNMYLLWKDGSLLTYF